MMETSTMSIVRRCLRPGSAWLTALLLLMAMVCASMGVAHAAETITYYYTSPQGTVLAKADASGNILSSADYRPYGTQALGTPEQGPGYTGHVNDVDSGLVYMQARYYDPSVGRFVNVDPVSGAAGNVTSQNRYAYALDNPVINVDPDGREAACVSQASHCGNIGAGISEYPGQAAGALDSINNEIVTPIIGANPVAFEELSVALRGVAGALRAMSATGEAAVLSSEVPVATAAASVDALPRMRVTDITSKGAKMPNYAVNWTKSQFESHLQTSGLRMEPRGPVNTWLNSDGAKMFSTRDFSKSGGPTGEIFRDAKQSASAKFRFDQSPGG
jgi:RHS repeat-associated protein